MYWCSYTVDCINIKANNIQTRNKRTKNKHTGVDDRYKNSATILKIEKLQYFSQWLNQGFPTYLFIEPNGQFLKRSWGGLAISQLMRH